MVRCLRRFGVEAAHLAHEAGEAHERVHVGRGFAQVLADLAHGADQRVELDGAAGFHVLQHRGLERAELARDGVAVFGALVDGDADARADGLGLQHDGADKPRTSGSSRMRSQGAPVRAEMGFMVMLPQSLNQMSRWMRSDTVTPKPACASSSFSACTRGDRPPPPARR
jgi:hypothetical protein